MSTGLGLYPATAADYRALAQDRLPRFLFDYIDGGATDEQTMRANVADWAHVAVRQRVLRDVSSVRTDTRLFEQDSRMPLALAPVGLAGMMARRGEVQAARAAQAAGVPFTLSTVGICPLQEVMQASAQPVWFQLYMIRDRGVVKALLQRAWDSGCRTLVFTVDLPVTGMRHRDTRNGLAAAGPRAAWLRAKEVLSHPHWLWDVALRGKPHSFGNLTEQVPQAHNLDAVKTWVDAQFDPSVTWDDIDWLRREWPGTLILKGILDAADARAAVQAGVQGIVVSNHGGRQLDGVRSTVSQLPGIVQAVGAQTHVLVDGGVRSGVDVFRALALGAKGVLIGRPWVWALAAAGEQGVYDLLTRWQRELQLAMMMAGVTSVAEIQAMHLDVSDSQER